MNKAYFCSVSMKEVIVIVFYTILMSTLVYKSSWFQFSNFSRTKLLALLIIKILASFIYVYISQRIIEAGDIFYYYNDSLIVYQHLLNGELGTFLQLTFGLNNVTITPNIASSVSAMGMWYDTSAYMMVRANTLINVATLGAGIYANALFFGSISFCAAVILTKLFYRVLPTNDNFVLHAIFLTPSLCYWTSGMHKESISVFLIALTISAFLKLIEKKVWYYGVILLFSFFFLFLTRFFISLMLLPPMIAYAIYRIYPKVRPILIYTSVFAFILGSTYLFPLIFRTKNLVDAVIAKKQLYEALGEGNTAISLGTYAESYFGIFLKIPQALFNAIVRPHFLDVKSAFLAFASVESFIISLALLGSLFYIKYLPQSKRALIFLFFSFSFSYLLLTGLIVPNLGAILRYRSVALFILIPTILVLWKQKDVIE